MERLHFAVAGIEYTENGKVVGRGYKGVGKGVNRLVGEN